MFILYRRVVMDLGHGCKLAWYVDVWRCISHVIECIEWPLSSRAHGDHESYAYILCLWIVAVSASILPALAASWQMLVENSRPAQMSLETHCRHSLFVCLQTECNAIATWLSPGPVYILLWATTPLENAKKLSGILACCGTVYASGWSGWWLAKSCLPGFDCVSQL